LAVSVPRAFALQQVCWTPDGAGYLIAALLSGWALGYTAISLPVLIATLVERSRRQSVHLTAEARRAARAIEDLQLEELRVRRMISDQLHGTLQYRLVTVAAGIDGLGARLAETNPEATAELHEWANRIEEIREVEVRSLSHSMLPSGFDLGAVSAIKSILDRVPTGVATSLEVGPECQQLLDEHQPPIPLAERLVIIYAIEEAISNALRHGRATSLKVYIELHSVDDPNRRMVEVDVDDNGVGLPPEIPPKFNGLLRHSERVESRGGALSLERSPLGGARLSFNLPIAYP